MSGQSPAIYITRHCKTAWNLEGRIQGSQDQPLSPEGIGQAQSLVPVIRPYGFAQIVASPLQRAVKTAMVYGQALEIPVATHPGLQELDHGDWEGQCMDVLKKDPAGDFAAWLADPTQVEIPGGGETVQAAQARVVDAFVEIAGMKITGAVLVVMHKHIRAILNCHLNGCGLDAFSRFIDDGIEPRKIALGQLMADRL